MIVFCRATYLHFMVFDNKLNIISSPTVSSNSACTGPIFVTRQPKELELKKLFQGIWGWEYLTILNAEAFYYLGNSVNSAITEGS